MDEKQRGRPRSARAHQAVMEATRDLLASVGYEQMSIEAIAAQAGVGKPTVYRWWRSKAAVVAEAALSGYLTGSAAPPPDTGDFEADLRQWVTALTQRLDNPADAALFRGWAAAAADSDTDTRRLYDQLSGPNRQQLIHRLEAAVAAGQLRADADLEAAADVLIGTMLYQVLARHPATAPQSSVDGFLDIFLVGLTRGSG
ncbi:TetR/AcrR family transcriptional regulator [Nocardia sp. NPDC059239]|uniref:TetR/AcrR family transcriptional regulator n=1 Tax=unclassified Nocardia TaxID=2637762 RepID=UPI0036ABA88F